MRAAGNCGTPGLKGKVIGLECPRGEGLLGGAGLGAASDILLTYSPLEIYSKSRRARIWIRIAARADPSRMSINRMDFGNSLHSPDVCVCCLRFFLFLRKNCPPSSRRTLRFRFYLSKVFHSAVIVWVASSIVAKANIYLGFSLLSICGWRRAEPRGEAGAWRRHYHCATNWICGTQIKCCRKKWLVAVDGHYQKIDRPLTYRFDISFLLHKY